MSQSLPSQHALTSLKSSDDVHPRRVSSRRYCAESQDIGAANKSAASSADSSQRPRARVSIYFAVGENISRTLLAKAWPRSALFLRLKWMPSIPPVETTLPASKKSTFMKLTNAWYCL